MDAEVARGHLGAKLAFARLSFNYFMSETVFEYILEAVHLVANEGWKLLPLYSFDPGSGLWRHPDARARTPLALHDVLTARAAARDRARERARRATWSGRAGHPRRRGAPAERVARRRR